MLASPPPRRVGAPTSGKSWIRHCKRKIAVQKNDRKGAFYCFQYKMHLRRNSLCSYGTYFHTSLCSLLKKVSLIHYNLYSAVNYFTKFHGCEGDITGKTKELECVLMGHVSLWSDRKKEVPVYCYHNEVFLFIGITV